MNDSRDRTLEGTVGSRADLVNQLAPPTTILDHSIVVRDVSKVFGRTRPPIEALRDVCLRVEPGQFTSIVGVSGSGKSTLLRMVGGLIEPSTGSILIGGLPPREAQRRKSIGFVFQDAALLPWRTVAENVGLSLRVNRSAQRTVPWGIDELLEMVGLEHFGNAYPHQLSGGMQQRVALARALVHDPSVLLMDEPFAALDEITRAQMRYELLRIWEQTGKTVLFVTHSVAEAVILSDAVVVIGGHPGRVRDVVPIDLPRPRVATVETDAEFVEHATRIRSALAGT